MISRYFTTGGCRAAKLPDPPTAVNILTLLLESERCAIRSWIEICDMTFGKDPRTYDLASRILNEEIEHGLGSSNCWPMSAMARVFLLDTSAAASLAMRLTVRTARSTLEASESLFSRVPPISESRPT